MGRDSLWVQYAVVRGFRVAYRGFANNKTLVRIRSSDPAVAAELGMQPTDTGEYMKDVPTSEVSQFYNESWTGVLDGVEVGLLEHEPEAYFVSTTSRALATNRGLYEIERGEWYGPVPKTAVERVRVERRQHGGP